MSFFKDRFDQLGKFIRGQHDWVEPWFEKGGKLEKLYPIYEAQDTFLFSPGETTKGSTHLRDSLDSKRMMVTVIVALIPCIFMAMYNTGFQASKVLGAAGVDVENLLDTNWRYPILNFLGMSITESGGFFNLTQPWLFISNIVHGALYFLPAWIVCMVAGGTCELIFSVIRKHEINEGFLVTGMLFPLTLPPTIPLWQVAVGIIFGVVVGKEIFGGTGRNFLNPALTARAFLYFAHAPFMTGQLIWTGATGTGIAQADGYSGATILGALAEAQNGESVAQVANELTVSYGGKALEGEGALTFWNYFWGSVPGSMGETSTFCCLLGAALLILTGIGSWRIMAGVCLGAFGLAALISSAGGQTAIFNCGPLWHYVIGGFAFGTVFMATDPVSAAMTNQGKWVYGILIGFMTIVIRAVNPAFPEGIMLAILFGNCFAPLIDYGFVHLNIQRRLARNAA